MLDSGILTRVFWASQVALVVKNPPANAEDVIDAGSIPGSGRSPGGAGQPIPVNGILEGKNTEVICHFRVCVCARARARTLQALQNGNLEARILQCFAISVRVCARMRAYSPGSSEWNSRGKNTAVICHFSSRGSSLPRDWSRISSVYCIAGKFFSAEPLGKPLLIRVNPIL